MLQKHSSTPPASQHRQHSDCNNCFYASPHRSESSAPHDCCQTELHHNTKTSAIPSDAASIASLICRLLFRTYSNIIIHVSFEHVNSKHESSSIMQKYIVIFIECELAVQNIIEKQSSRRLFADISHQNSAAVSHSFMLIFMVFARIIVFSE